MATIKKFEDLEIWQLAMELSNDIYYIIKNTDLKADFALRNQIDKSSISVSDNIAEGFEREGNREFIQFLSIAKGSCGEVRSQLYKLKNRKHIEDVKFEELKNKAELTSKKISSFMNYLKNTDHKGNKFQEPEAEYQPQTSNLKPQTSNLKPFFAHET